MVVDEVLSVATVPAAQVTSPGSIVPGLEFLSGILRLPGSGIVLIHDVDAFLSLDDEARLALALEEGGGP
jgi:chemotaxis signal transduction protein